MDAQRWQLLEELFQRALALPDAGEQRRFLEALHQDDASLVEEVLAMLREDRAGASLLDQDVGRIADTMLNPRLPPGAAFGPYIVERILGEGGMGVVCLARRDDLGSRAAIKVLRDAWLSPARRDRFALEQRVLAQLNHPCIARLYDAGSLPDGTPWFAMEYIEGEPLTDYCRRHACSIERRLQLFRQACEAVRFSHAHAVIHRDIKPSNILVKADGSVKLLDFGIAKQLDGLEQATGTRTVFRVMTPAYAAPEQLHGGKIGVHTDVYSLGVVAYELVAGCLPFSTRGMPVLENPQAAARVPQRPSSVARQEGRTIAGRTEWADLDVLCMTAMHPDPERRYSSVEALLRDLDHYLRLEPLDARPDGFRYRAGKFLRRHWQMASVAAAAAVLILGLSVVFTVRLARARDVALLEAARTQRVQQLMTSLFQGGEPLAGPASNLKVIDVLDRGAREAEALTTDPAVQAELMQNLAGIYEKLRQLESADSLLQKTLQLRTSLYGADSPQVAETLVATGLLRLDQARLDEAEQLVRRGVELTAGVLPVQHPQTIAASLALGRVLRERGAHDQAIALLSEVALLQARDGVAPTDRAAALSELGDAHYSAGHYAASRDLYQRVLALHRSQLGASHPLVAADLGTLAAIQQDLGYYVEAEQLGRQALQIVEGWYGTESLQAADHLTALGRALVYQKKYADAGTALQRAISIQEKALGTRHPAVAETVNELGNMLATQGHYAAAEKHFARAAGIYRDVYGDRHYLVAIALSNVAYMQMQQKEYAQAEALFRDVVARFTEGLAPDNVNTGIARIKLGRTLLRAGRQREAAVESLAGYQILNTQTNPAISYLRAAREDLVAEYEALREPDMATRFREELAASGPVDPARQD